MADISREGILLAGGGRALLLQLAHPAVGAGVVAHSDFDARPLDRLHGTLSFVYAIATGSADDAARVRRAVNRAHVPVRGAGYNAMDGQLQLWVAATLYDSAMVMWERTYGALPDDVAERVYREYAVLGTALQMPAELWPADRRAFADYVEATTASLAVDDAVRAVRARLLDGRVLPRPLRPLMPLVSRATTGLLPPRVRELYRLDWSEQDAARLDRDLARLTRVYRALPRGIRQYPRAYYLRRARRAA